MLQSYLTEIPFNYRYEIEDHGEFLFVLDLSVKVAVYDIRFERAQDLLWINFIRILFAAFQIFMKTIGGDVFLIRCWRADNI